MSSAFIGKGMKGLRTTIFNSIPPPPSSPGSVHRYVTQPRAVQTPHVAHKLARHKKKRLLNQSLETFLNPAVYRYTADTAGSTNARPRRRDTLMRQQQATADYPEDELGRYRSFGTPSTSRRTL